MKKISVIVPIYNVEDYLCKCVDSIINQTYKNLEIILVDDGSPDNCPKICDEYAKTDNRIKVVHKKNGGLSDARNAGMKIATGEYVSFIDSDDWLELDTYEIMVKAMIDNNTDIVSSNYKFIYKDHEKIAYENTKNKTYGNKEAYKLHLDEKLFSAHVWNKLYKREIIGDLQFEFGKVNEDEFYTYQIIGKINKATYVSKPLYNYLQRENSIINTMNVKRLDGFEGRYNRLVYTKKNYSELYSYTKMLFLHDLWGWNTLSQTIEDKYIKTEIKKMLKNYRKKLKFNFKDLKTYDIKDNIRIILSKFKF